jgi:hypothetical protein
MIKKNIIVLHTITSIKMSLSRLGDDMGGIELSAPTLSPETVRLMQLALYYDFVLFNMQQKPFGVLLVLGGGAIMNTERGTIQRMYAGTNTVGELHNALVDCLTDKKNCNDKTINDILRDNVDYLKETLYVPSKIAEFKGRGKTTPAELYDLLNPGDGDINVAIQNAASKIKALASSTVPYLGDEVFTLISNGAAVEFLDQVTVEAMRSILANTNQGGRTRRRQRRRGTKRRGTKRHNRRGRTRRH